ncbi:MAG TPA: zinc-binding dehydrogenase [Candidatus Binataceae bacterium]|nr:zinc-binding dehydrogenase [Candidatus Binataceae bacterium]
MTECKVAVVTKFNAPLEVWKAPLPDIAVGGALARVEAATLCGTDAHRWQGHLTEGGGVDLPFIEPTTTPFVPGHETCSRLEETRGQLYDLMNEPLKVGERVIASYPHCGHCYYCVVTRQPTLCAKNLSFGHSAPGAMLGGCAEYHYYPPGGSFIRVPEEVSSPLAASAACALRTVMHGYEQLGALGSHESVLILGCGPLGLYSLAVAKDFGAKRTLVIGAPQARLKVAQQWGADAVLNLDEVSELKQRRQWVLDQTGGRGADVVFQCANSRALPEALQMTRPGGRLINIGVSGGPPIEFDPMHFFKQVRINSVVMAEARHFYQAIDFLATRRRNFHFDQLLSGQYTLDRTGEALKAMSEYREVKPVVLPALAN